MNVWRASGRGLYAAIIALAAVTSCARSTIPVDGGNADADEHVSVDGASPCSIDAYRPNPVMCDSLGAFVCNQWAHDYGGDAAVGACVETRIRDCVRGNFCPPGETDPSGCRCGQQSPCTGSEVCRLGADGDAGCASVCP